MNSLYRGISLAAVFWTTVSMSAYTPHETGSRTTASGARAKEGYTCAANFVPMGSVIIYEGHKYVVQDRMNPKYNRHVDIFMESHKKALQFGRKNAKVQVITPDDKQVKLPKENKHKHKENRSKQIETKTESNQQIPTEETKPTPKQHIPTEETKAAPNQQIPTEETKIQNKSDNSSRSHSPAAAPVFKPQVRP
jgi:3D (Asp-Asp-Asp) domain-containing protein